MKATTLLCTMAARVCLGRTNGRPPRWAITTETLTTDDLIADLDPGWLAWRETLANEEAPCARVA
jgi:hypothetical protein